MYRIVFIQILMLLFVGNSLFAYSKKKDKEISTARKLEYYADSALSLELFNEASIKYQDAAIIFEKNKLWIDATKNYRQAAWCYFNLMKIDSSQYFINYSKELLNRKIKNLNEQVQYEESEIHYVQAKIHLHNQDFDSTIVYLNKGLEIVNRLCSINSSYSLHKAKFLKTLGTTNYYKGNYDDALKFNYQALDIKQEVLKPSDNSIQNSYWNIVLIYFNTRDYEKANQYCWEIINNCTKESRAREADAYNCLGVISYISREYDKTILYYKKALEITIEENGEDSQETAMAINNLGKIYGEIKDYHNALSHIEKSLKIIRKEFGNDSPKLSEYLLTLGEYYCKINEYEQASKQYLEAIEILNKNNHSDKTLKSKLYQMLGQVYIKQNNLPKASESFQNSITEIIDGFYYTVEHENPNIFIKETNLINESYNIISKTTLYDNLIYKAINNLHYYELDKSRIEKLAQSFYT